jgi:hypothetical protein
VLLGWSVFGALLALLITTVVSVTISVWLAIKLVINIPLQPTARSGDVKKPSDKSLRQRIISYAGLNYLINWSVYLYDLDFIVLAMTLLISRSGSGDSGLQIH